MHETRKSKGEQKLRHHGRKNEKPPTRAANEQFRLDHPLGDAHAPTHVRGNVIPKGLNRKAIPELQYLPSMRICREGSRLIDVSELTPDHKVLSEQFVNSEVKVPRKVYREEVIEKVIVVPETIRVEEVVEDTVKVREKVIKVGKPVYQEKIVEVPEIEYVEKIVEVPEVVVQETIREVPKIEVVERVSRVPKVVVEEKIVEVPDYEYREVEMEQIVEVPEIREEVVYKDVEEIVEEFVDVPVFQTIQVPQDIERYLPVPVEAITYYEFRLPKMTAKYVTSPYPIYAPRFIEVPIPTSAINESQKKDVNFVRENVQALCVNPSTNMCEIEKLAEFAKTRDYDFRMDESLLQSELARGEI